VAVRRSLGFAHVLCLSIVGSESRGNTGSFLIHVSGARVYGNLQK
jgi:hypothetical protein